jgi:hypothetical protein
MASWIPHDTLNLSVWILRVHVHTYWWYAVEQSQYQLNIEMQQIGKKPRVE